MSVTASGTSTVCSFGQFAKLLSSKVVTVSGSTTDTKSSLSLKAPEPMAVTARVTGVLAARALEDGSEASSMVEGTTKLATRVFTPVMVTVPSSFTV